MFTGGKNRTPDLKVVICILLMFAPCAFAAGVKVDWIAEHQGNGTRADYLYAMVTDNEGNTYMADESAIDSLFMDDMIDDSSGNNIWYLGLDDDANIYVSINARKYVDMKLSKPIIPPSTKRNIIFLFICLFILIVFTYGSEPRNR